MTTIEIGPFKLIDPPGEQGEVIAEAIRNIEFPWIALKRMIEADSDKAIIVEWSEDGMGQVSGLYYGGANKIVMSAKPMHMDRGAGFVFAHEVGHMIDDGILDDKARRELLHAMHPQPYLQIGHFNHDHPDAGHRMEIWSNGSDSYVSRVYECFADQFVAAFAPTIWDGTFLDGAPKRSPRFVHWTEEHEKIKAVVAESIIRQNLIPDPTPHEEEIMKPSPYNPKMEKPMFKDVGIKHPRRKYVEWAVKKGYLDGKGRRFFPRRKVTRAELAEALYRAHHRR